MDKLIEAGVTTLQALSSQKAKDLAEKSGMTEQTAEKVIRKAVEMVMSGYITAAQLQEVRSLRTHLKTGCDELDNLLGGGIESETTTELIGAGACHSDDTQVVTYSGFKNWQDMKKGDSILGVKDGIITETQIEEIYSYSFDGLMINIKNGKIDLLVTPNHDVYFAPLGRNPQKIHADSLFMDCSWGWIPLQYPSDIKTEEDIDIGLYIERPKLDYPLMAHQKYTRRIFPASLLLELMGFYISDGSPLKQHHSIYPVFNHIRNQKRLIEIIELLGLKYGIYEKRKVVVFNDFLGRYLLRCGDRAPRKHIPFELFSYNLQYLYDGLMQADADKDKRHYYTSSKLLAEQFVLLCTLLGKQGNDHIKPPKTSIWKKTGQKIIGRYPYHTISISSHPYTWIEKKYVTTTPYKGTVWCFKTTTGNFFTTRGKTIILSGNSGKTQVCSTLAVLAQQPVEQGGLGGSVAWVDSESTMIPARIKEIALTRGFDPEKTMNGIFWALARNTEHQKKLIEQLYALIPQHNIKLVIVDSMMGHLRAEFIGRATLNERQGDLGRMLQILLQIALSMKVTIVYTNQVVTDPSIMYGNAEKPAGGNIMSHAAGTRLHLRKGREGARVAKLIDSLSLPEGEAIFFITEKGIEGKPEEGG